MTRDAKDPQVHRNDDALMQRGGSPEVEPPAEPVTATADAGGATSPQVPAPPAAQEEPRDPFDPARLRLNQDFGVGIGVRKILTTVPVRKPEQGEDLRPHAPRPLELFGSRPA